MRDNNLNTPAEVELETPPAASPDAIADILAKVIAHDPLSEEEAADIDNPNNAAAFDALLANFLKAYAAKSGGDHTSFDALPTLLKELLTEKARKTKDSDSQKALAILADVVAMTQMEDRILHRLCGEKASQAITKLLHGLKERGYTGEFPLDEYYASEYGKVYPDIWRVPKRALENTQLDNLTEKMASTNPVRIMPEETTLPSWREAPASSPASPEGRPPRGIVPARMNGLLYDLAAMMAARLDAIGEKPDPNLSRDQWPVVDLSHVKTTNWKPHEIRAAFESRGILIREPITFTSKLTVEAAPAGLTVEAAPAGLTVEAAPAGLTVAATPAGLTVAARPASQVRGIDPRPETAAKRKAPDAEPAEPSTDHRSHVRVGK